MIDIKKLENVILKKYYHSYLCCYTAYMNTINLKKHSLSFYYELLSYMEKKYPKNNYVSFIEVIEKIKDGMNVLEELFCNSKKLNNNSKRKNALKSIERSYLIKYLFIF